MIWIMQCSTPIYFQFVLDIYLTRLKIVVHVHEKSEKTTQAPLTN